MKLNEFKKQLKQLEAKLLAEYNLSDEEVELSVTMLTNELGRTCSELEAVYHSTVHNELLVLEGRNFH